MKMERLQEEKRALRREALRHRRSLAAVQIEDESEAIFRRIAAFEPYLEAKIVMCYAALPEEIQTQAILRHALASGKRVCVPLIRDRTMGSMDAAYIGALEDLSPGAFGIDSTDETKYGLAAPAEIGLIFVPGVAFDRSGGRIGMGAGFYDRFLAKAPAALPVALALECQVFERVPRDAFDAKIRYLATRCALLDTENGVSM